MFISASDQQPAIPGQMQPVFLPSNADLMETDPQQMIQGSLKFAVLQFRIKGSPGRIYYVLNLLAGITSAWQGLVFFPPWSLIVHAAKHNC